MAARRTNLVDQGNISGSATTTLTLANVPLPMRQLRCCSDKRVRRRYEHRREPDRGTPNGPVASRIIALGAMALWELNETNDPALAAW